jgi:aconitate hydratase
MSFLDSQKITRFYAEYPEKLQHARTLLQRPLTYTEKILYTHATSLQLYKKGNDSIPLQVDRVAMQDATAQMALLQFMLTGKKNVAVPTTVHCDHLIVAKVGAKDDLQEAQIQNNEVYQFLQSASNKYGIGFWKPGSGIIHQVVLENYAIPGQLMIGTDSHTPNAGGLGMLAIGVGGADAVDVIAGLPWNVTMPKLIGVYLTGKLNGWTAPKDIILKVAEILTVKGGTGAIIEYFGEGTKSISATGKATITNMGAEIGATTSIFPYDEHTKHYLNATNRSFISEMITSKGLQQELRADKEVLQNPQTFFDELIAINLDELKSHIVGPHTPDLAHTTGNIGDHTEQNGWPTQLSAALIGSCTNSSYQDMSRAVSIAKQAAMKGVKAKIPFMVTPGSEQIHKTIQRDGQLSVFEEIGAKVLANACGPCIGQWNRQDAAAGTTNSIITSYNRNFKKRNDANSGTHAFIASPEIVTAYALAGTFDFNPLTDPLTTMDGTQFMLEPPTGDDLPQQGFVFDTSGYQKPTGEGNIAVNPDSERIALLTPFQHWKQDDFTSMAILVKAKGKCTTDHISPAGKWLRYRGHLDNISDNMYSGAVNMFTEEVGNGLNVLTQQQDDFNTIARFYRQNNQGWVVIADENYGEGSSREHAAMEPRHLGCRAVIAKSFARIAETNLKKQAVLPLWFTNKEEYDIFQENDRITIGDITLEVGKPVFLCVTHENGSTENIETTHTLTMEQIAWFTAGSSLNWIREDIGKV